MMHRAAYTLSIMLLLSCSAFAHAQLPYYDSDDSAPRADVSNFWVPSYRPTVPFPHEWHAQNLRDLGSTLPRDSRFNSRFNRPKRVGGCVEVHYLIAQDGRAKNIEVVTEYPNGIYIDTALNAIQRYRWQATASNTERVPVVSNALFVFHNPSIHPLHQEASCDWPEQAIAGLPENCRDSRKSRLLKTCD